MTNTLLPTSIVGSLPKPAWLAQPEVLWSPWELSGAALVEGKQDALRAGPDPDQAFFPRGATFAPGALTA